MSGVEVPTDQVPTDQAYVIKYNSQGMEVPNDHPVIRYKL